MNALDSQLFAMTGDSFGTLRSQLWNTMDEEISLADCDIYRYTALTYNVNQVNCISFMYFSLVTFSMQLEGIQKVKYFSSATTQILVLTLTEKRDVCGRSTTSSTTRKWNESSSLRVEPQGNCQIIVDEQNWTIVGVSRHEVSNTRGN